MGVTLLVPLNVSPAPCVLTLTHSSALYLSGRDARAAAWAQRCPSCCLHLQWLCAGCPGLVSHSDCSTMW
jgi:hypothetical protein